VWGAWSEEMTVIGEGGESWDHSASRSAGEWRSGGAQTCFAPAK
jgi:hypothetical protein